MKIFAWILSLVVRTWVRTLRVEIVGPAPPKKTPLVFAFLHGQQMALLKYPKPPRVAVLTSLSRDGTIQSRVLGYLGFVIVRGSSSRGGEAGLMGLIREVRRGASAAVAVDGPKGPAGRVKPGAVFVARAVRGVVVPIVVVARRAHRLSRSWDRFMIPLPWSSVRIVRGQPIEVARGCDDDEIETCRARLEKALVDLSESDGDRLGVEGRNT